jgi:hypothetical protein
MVQNIWTLFMAILCANSAPSRLCGEHTHTRTNTHTHTHTHTHTRSKLPPHIYQDSLSLLINIQYWNQAFAITVGKLNLII